jgi:hypothetical protein
VTSDLAALERGEARGRIGNGLEDQRFTWGLAPVAVDCLEHQLHAGVNETKR